MSDAEHYEGPTRPDLPLLRRRPDESDEELFRRRLEAQERNRERGDTLKPAGHRYNAPSACPDDSGTEPPEYIVPDVLPVAVGGLVGGGGAHKSTFVLWSMLHIAAGLPLFGREINRPGLCVFVTAEDEKSLIDYRLREMKAALLEGWALDERQRITSQWHEHLRIEDLSGEVDCRYVRFDRLMGVMEETEEPENLIGAYRQASPSLIAIDPAVYFGPGEQLLNDGMAALMACGKRIRRELNCAVMFVHHVAQTTGRAEIIDAYSGRGGTAFGDNSRFMYVMLSHNENKSKEYPPPAAMAPVEFPARIHQVKNSLGPKLQRPLWWGRASAWEFIGAGDDPQQRAENLEEEKAQRETDLVEHFLPFFAEEFPHGATRQKVDDCAGKDGRFWIGAQRVSRQAARGFLDMAAAQGYVAQAAERKPFMLTASGWDVVQAVRKGQDARQAADDVAEAAGAEVVELVASAKRTALNRRPNNGD